MIFKSSDTREAGLIQNKDDGQSAIMSRKKTYTYKRSLNKPETVFIFVELAQGGIACARGKEITTVCFDSALLRSYLVGLLVESFLPVSRGEGCGWVFLFFLMKEKISPLYEAALV